MGCNPVLKNVIIHNYYYNATMLYPVIPCSILCYHALSCATMLYPVIPLELLFCTDSYDLLICVILRCQKR